MTSPRRAEQVAVLCFLLAILAAVGLAVVYWRGGQPQWEGVLLSLTLGGIGSGAVLWGKHLLPPGEVSEERKPLASSSEDRKKFVEELAVTPVQVGEQAGQPQPGPLRARRGLLLAASGAITALGAALLFPIRSLGPRPGGGLTRTRYADGVRRVVQQDGTPMRLADLEADSVVTVWPEGHPDDADSAALLIRLRDEQDLQPREGREDWSVEGVVAYSKLCTHVGCPVGLYQAESALLLCPCHQSTFDVLDGARPVFGPAARSLPQLPLDVDDEGYIVARGDFSSPVGPGFWDRGTEA